jgi:hypothetical protein
LPEAHIYPSVVRPLDDGSVPRAAAGRVPREKGNAGAPPAVISDKKLLELFNHSRNMSEELLAVGSVSRPIRRRTVAPMVKPAFESALVPAGVQSVGLQPITINFCQDRPSDCTIDDSSARKWTSHQKNSSSDRKSDGSGLCSKMKKLIILTQCMMTAA